MSLTRSWLVGWRDWISTAELSTTVSMALSPATFIVSPDSSPSATCDVTRLALTDEIDNPVRNSQCTRRLHAAPNILDRRPPLLPTVRPALLLQPLKVLPREV